MRWATTGIIRNYIDAANLGVHIHKKTDRLGTMSEIKSAGSAQANRLGVSRGAGKIGAGCRGILYYRLPS